MPVIVYSTTLGVMLIIPVVGSCVNVAGGIEIGVPPSAGTLKVPLM